MEQQEQDTLLEQARTPLTSLIKQVENISSLDRYSEPFEFIYERNKLSLLLPCDEVTEPLKISEYPMVKELSKLMKQQPNERLAVIFGDDTTGVEVRATMPDGISANGTRMYLARGVHYDTEEDGTLMEGGVTTYEVFDIPDEDETVYNPAFTLDGYKLIPSRRD